MESLFPAAVSRPAGIQKHFWRRLELPARKMAGRSSCGNHAAAGYFTGVKITRTAILPPGNNRLNMPVRPARDCWWFPTSASTSAWIANQPSCRQNLATFWKKRHKPCNYSLVKIGYCCTCRFSHLQLGISGLSLDSD